jgi:RHS repeat-associated core domain
MQGFITKRFSPGTYYIAAEPTGSNNGIINVNLTAPRPVLLGDDIDHPIPIGYKDGSFTYCDKQNTKDFACEVVYYSLYIAQDMELTVSNCGSEVDDSFLYIMGENGFYEDNDDYDGNGNCGNTRLAYHRTFLPAGYYIISTYGYDSGNLLLNVSGVPMSKGVGDTFDNPIKIGYKNDDFTYSDTKNTTDFYNNGGNYLRDVFYSFVLGTKMDVTISHCGSGLNDTYLHLLDWKGAEIAANNNSSGSGACSNTAQAYIRKTLPAGTYYIISEGTTGNGNITTTLHGSTAVVDQPASGTTPAGSSQNYIYTITPTVASTDVGALTTNQSLQTVQYFDGLGRPSQTVQRGITRQGADLVSGIEYDDFGRQTRQWLPGAVTGNNGAFVSDFGTPARNSNAGESKPYTLTEYEPTPLNRITGQYGSGSDWQNNGKKKKLEYTTNSSNSVKLFVVTGSGLTLNGYYDANTLYGQKNTDEDGKTVEEFADKLGHKVLSRTAGDHDTYYVYDDYNNLSYVLPPLAADAINSSSDCGETAGTPLDLYGYIYHYDGRKRCIEKKLPGCAWVYMVYDYTDRLILSQDGNQRTKNQWTVNKYDQFDRLLYSGLITDESSREIMKIHHSNIVVNESYTGSGPMAGYTCSSLMPAILLMVNYYDNYSYLAYSGNNPGGIMTYSTISGYTAPDATPSAPAYAKTMLTGTRVYYLDDPSKYGVTALYYDKYGRTVQTRATNHLNGYDYEFFAYNFTGQPLKKRHVHKAYTYSEITEDYTFNYDHAGRQVSTYHAINGRTPIKLDSIVYNELGQLSKKILHNGIQTIDHTYNIRGWQKSINSTEFKETLFYQDGATAGATPAYNGNISAQQWSTKQKGNALCQYAYTYDQLNRLKKAKYSPDELYNEEIGQYDKNGNIKSLVRNGHVFDYWDTFQMIPGVADDLTLEYNGNQLKTVINNVDTEFGSPIFVDKWDENNPIEYLYDKNGNQTADLNKSIAWMKYNFLNLPEKIQFSDGSKSQYLYDAAGVKRQAKYTYAAAPIQIPLGRTDQEYTGAVSGTMTIDYCWNYIYENGTVKRILTPDGFLESRFTSGTFFPSSSRYDYYLKDHLGNTQVCLQSDFLNRPTSPSYTVAQVNSYYPFGQETDANYKNGYDASNQPYLYNGKEIDRMNGLNMLDYGARWYDPTIGRWGVVDPLAEKYYSWTPYDYCRDNSIRFIDPDGRADGDPNSGGTPSRMNSNGVYTAAQSTAIVKTPERIAPIKPSIVKTNTESSSRGRNVQSEKSPTISMKQHNEIKTPVLSVDGYSKTVTVKGDENVEIVKNANTKMKESEISTTCGVVNTSKGMDGSSSLGIGSIALGSNGSQMTVDVSQKIPFTETTIGVTISIPKICLVLVPVIAPEAALVCP